MRETYNRKKATPPGEQEKHISAWQDSNLSQKDYCALHNIKPATFSLWKKKFSETQEHPARSGGFVALPMGSENIRLRSCAQAPITIVIKDSIKVEVNSEQVSSEVLRKVVVAVQELL